MNFEGIQITEGRLLTHNIFSSILLLIAAAVAGALLIYTLYQGVDKKSKLQISRLKERAQTDPIAAKRLQKLERKYRRKNKELFNAESLFIFAVLLVIIFLLLFLCVIPGWTDYILKDYEIYEGEFEVVRYIRISYIIFEDGTRVSGGLGMEDGTYNRKIVYSSRTKMALGVE